MNVYVLCKTCSHCKNEIDNEVMVFTRKCAVTGKIVDLCSSCENYNHEKRIG